MDGSRQEHFGKVIYQYDRFHITRDVRRALRGNEDRWKKAKKALKADRIDEVIPLLQESLAENSGDEKRKKHIVDLIARFERDKEYIVDYRKRIGKGDWGIELRGMGAAETSVKRFRNRMKSVGKSWSEGGANAIAQVLAKQFSGTYADYLDMKIPDYHTIREPGSPGKIGTTIKGIRIGSGATRGTIVKLRPGYSGMARMFRKLSS